MINATRQRTSTAFFPPRESSLLKLSPKQIARRHKFQAINNLKDSERCSRQGDPNVSDYHTGLESRFHLGRGASAEVNEIHGIGPVFKTPQWIRTVKESK